MPVFWQSSHESWCCRAIPEGCGDTGRALISWETSPWQAPAQPGCPSWHQTEAGLPLRMLHGKVEHSILFLSISGAAWNSCRGTSACASSAGKLFNIWSRRISSTPSVAGSGWLSESRFAFKSGKDEEWIDIYCSTQEGRSMLQHTLTMPRSQAASLA